MSEQAEPPQQSGGGAVELPPLPDLEPPVPIVEQVLYAEEHEPYHEPGGLVTEPKASTRDEEHGDAALQRAEVEELAEEVAESLPEGQLDIATPVGTTGADVGFNPDTAEADLQQPGTPPVADPGTIHAVLSEQETLSAAADPDKG